MIVKLDPKKLKRHLWHKGPYMYFYNGYGSTVNENIVLNMTKMSSKHPKLTIFEINWKDQIYFDPNSSEKLINQVFLYFNRKLIAKKTKPNKNEIKRLFNKAIVFHNEHMEIKAKNLGTRPRTIRFDKEKLTYTIGKKNKIIDNSQIKSKRKRILNNKIIKYDNSMLSKKLLKSYIPITQKFDIKNETNTPTTNILVSKMNFQNTLIENKKLKSPNPWFFDVKISEMPSEILINEVKPDLVVENDKINIGFIRNSTLHTQNIIASTNNKQSFLKENDCKNSISMNKNFNVSKHMINESKQMDIINYLLQKKTPQDINRNLDIPQKIENQKNNTDKINCFIIKNLPILPKLFPKK